MTLMKAGVLLRAKYHDVANVEEGGKNLRECVKRIDDCQRNTVRREEWY
jgi:hypothetical protein